MPGSFTPYRAGTCPTCPTCGLTTSGAAYCSGANGNGRPGDGATGNKPAPVAVAGP